MGLHLPSARFIRGVATVLCLVFPLFPSISRAAETPARIDGRAIARALQRFYATVKDKEVTQMTLTEVVRPGEPPLAARHPGTRIRLATDMPVDSVLTSPDININVYLERKTHLSAELWKLFFEWDGTQWTPQRFQAILRAEVGDQFVPDVSSVYKFDALTIAREAMTFHVSDGYLVPAFSSGKVGRVAIFGKGRFVFTVTSPVERQQLNKYAARTDYSVYTVTNTVEQPQPNKPASHTGDQLSGSFTRMALILSQAGYRNMIDGVRLERVKNKRIYKKASRLLKNVDKDYKMKVRPLKQKWSFRPTTRDYLTAEFDMSSRNWLVYSYNPFELEQVSLTQKSGFPRNFKLKPPVLWCHFRVEDAPSHAPVSNALLHIEQYSIQGALEKNKKTLKLKTRVRFMALDDSVAVASFVLNKKFDVRRVDYADGEGALHIQQGSFLSIPLRTPLQKGEHATLTFYYEGNPIARTKPSFYTPLKNEEWLPRHSDRDAFHFDLTMRVPKSLTVITTGTRTDDREEGDVRVSHWQSTRPINLLGLTFSDYKAVTTASNGIDVTVYTRKGPRKSSPRVQEILDTVDKTLPFYNDTFGKYPYKKLDIMQMPDSFTFGQGLPTLLMLWGLYFRSDYILSRDLPVNAYYNVQNFYKTFLAHELAHQWWGNVVVPRTYRDAWLSEGLATYAADLFIEKTAGADTFHDLLKDHMSQAQGVDREGAISLGYRLKKAYQPVVYDKGAMVLHMLRQVCGDEKFYTVLNTFYKQASSTLVTTADFQRVTEKVMDRKMDWFFEEWLQGTGYPVYRVDYTSTHREDGRYRIQCTLSQQQKGRLFTMPVPIRIELKNGEKIDKVVWNTGRYQTFEMILPDKVKRITPAPDCAVYCETEGGR